MGGTIGLQRPDLHLSQPLTTKLRFTAKWLLSYKGVWTCRTSVNLVIYKVMQLKNIHDTYCYLLVKLLT